MTVFGKKRRGTDEIDYVSMEFLQLVAESGERVDYLNRVARERWGVGAAERWSADLTEGTLTFHFGDHVVTGPAEVVGSFSSETRTWLWAWANESLPPHVTRASAMARDAGRALSLAAFEQPKLRVDEASTGDDLAAVAVTFADMAGVYRAPTRTGYIWFALRDFTSHPLVA